MNTILLVLAAVLLVPIASYAAGLGTFTVRSALGQPLDAEIEVVALHPGEDFQVRLATREAYREAGIDLSPALQGARFAVERRDGKTVIRVRTTQPVNDPFFTVLVEMQWPTGRLARQYTVLVDPVEFKIASTPAPDATAAAPASAVVPPVTAAPPSRKSAQPAKAAAKAPSPTPAAPAPVVAAPPAPVAAAQAPTKGPSVVAAAPAPTPVPAQPIVAAPPAPAAASVPAQPSPAPAQPVVAVAPPPPAPVVVAAAAPAPTASAQPVAAAPDPVVRAPDAPSPVAAAPTPASPAAAPEPVLASKPVEASPTRPAAIPAEAPAKPVIAAPPAPAPTAPPVVAAVPIAPAPAAPAQIAAAPAATSAQAPAPVPVTAPMQQSSDASETYRIRRGDTLGEIARKWKREGVTYEQMLMGLYQMNRVVFIRDNINLIRAGATLFIPGREDVLAISAADATRQVRTHMAAFNRYRETVASAHAGSSRISQAQREVISRRVGVKRSSRAM